MEGNNNEAEKEAKPSCCTRFKTSMHNAGRFIYNPDTKEVLGRGGLSWLKILAFYIGFYAILAGFWAACMIAFIRTLDPVAPTMQQMFSMMKDNPGMNYEPFTDTSKTMITFNRNDSKTYKDYVEKLTSVYSAYKNLTNVFDSTHKMCSVGNGSTLDVSCRFDVSVLGNYCTPENKFGYNLGEPCVLLRINRVFLWQPNGVTFDNANKCPSSSGQDCTKQNEFLKLPSTVKSNIETGFISVSCEGENEGDQDNIQAVTFYPEAGFPAYFYPYYNQDNYTSPLVMAKFKVIPGRVSLILCKLWTRDVIHDKNDLQGSIHFELFVDP